jgi:hypothetical protein
VTRGSNGTTALAHYKFTPILALSLLDQVPQPTVAQANLPDTDSYIDPWVGTF